MFEPFYREPGDAADRGSGLGLAITRGFIEANGGRVSAESLPEQGATFIVELPLPVEGGSGQPAGDGAGEPAGDRAAASGR